MSVDPTAGPLADFFEQCPSLLLIADPGGVILRLSASLGRLLGPEARVGAKLAASVHPGDVGALQAGWSKLTEGEAPHLIDALELRLRAKDGATRAVSMRARRSPSRGEIYAEFEERDVTRSAPTEELARDARLLRVILDTLPIMVANFDTQGVYRYHDGGGHERAGMKPGTLIGQNVFELFGDDSILIPLRRAFEGEPSHSFGEFQGLSLEVWSVPARDDQGKVESVFNISLDLSEVKRAEMELREKIALIERQQQVIREMATPIIEVWDKVLTLPMLGVVDTMRASDVMENLLTQVSRKGARFAILDLTGVDAVDTGTASHLLKLVQALRLLGAEGIITGIQPSVAQTMVALGVDMENIVTLANLRDGLRLCMKRLREEKAGAAASVPAEPPPSAAISVDKKG